jgi:hypothetical protein
VVPADGAWHHVVLVFDSSFTANYYIDGQPTDSIPGPAAVHTAALDFMIGRNPASGAEEFFNGSIDEVAVYGAELGADRILAHYNAGIAP